MPLNIDWDSKIIQITSPDVSVSGQILHDFIEDQMATTEGLLYDDILKPEGKIEDPTNPGVFSQIILVLSSLWQVQFWAGSGYTKIFGAKIVGGFNDQPMKATGAAGDITVLESPVDGVTVAIDSGSGVTDQDKTDIINGVWDKPDIENILDDSKGKIASHTKYIEHSIYIDEDEILNGDGSQHRPFNNTNDAITFAKSENIKNLIVRSDIILTQELKSFTILGIEYPNIECNNQVLNKTEFTHCKLRGSYSGRIRVYQSYLKNGFILSGNFQECSLDGDLVCGNEDVVKMIDCYSGIAGLGRPTISMGSSGTVKLSIRDNRGGLTVHDCTDPNDIVTVEISVGSLTFASTCTGGEMVARGVCKFVDETTGANVTDETIKPEDIQDVLRVLGLDINDPMTIGNGKFLSALIDIDVIDNLNGTYTLSRQ